MTLPPPPHKIKLSPPPGPKVYTHYRGKFTEYICGHMEQKNIVEVIIFFRGDTMNMGEAIDYINSNPTQFLQPDRHKGFICPICGSGQGKNGTGISSKDGKYFTCWAGRCFTNATVTDILALKAGISDISHSNFRQVAKMAVKEAGITVNDGDKTPNSKPRRLGTTHNSAKPNKNTPISAEYIARCKRDLANTDYLSRRGISQGTLDKFAIGFDAKFPAGGGKTWQAILFFTGEASYEARNCDEKATGSERHRKQGAGQIFNREALKGDEPVFVCESIIDALSIIEVGGQAVSAGGTSGGNMLTDAVQGGRVTVPCLILAFDGDDAGRNAENKTLNELKSLGYPCLSAADFFYADGNGKDPNELLLSDRVKFSERVKAAKAKASESIAAHHEEYMQNCAIYAAYDMAHALECDALCYATGFPALDKILDGGIYAGLYCVGAISSLGKTTFCLQVADNMAAQGADVLIYSLEMSRFELLAKSFSRLTYLENHDTALTTRDILTGRFRFDESSKAIWFNAFDEYGQFGEHIFITEGIGDIGVEQIRAGVMRHIRETKRRPVVLIDYLQILAPPAGRFTDKQAVDKNIMELKRLSRDVEIPIIGISSFNRENYNSPVNLASFKESGAVEYSSDVLLGLQYQGMDYSEGESESRRKERLRDLVKENREREIQRLPLEVELKILKNRNGVKGRVGFNFFSAYNCFVEDASIGSPKSDSILIR